MCIADVALTRFLEEPLIPDEQDEVTRLILDEHDANAFAAISDLTVGGLRDWLLSYRLLSASDESPVQGLREASLRRETACASGTG